MMQLSLRIAYADQSEGGRKDVDTSDLQERRTNRELVSHLVVLTGEWENLLGRLRRQLLRNNGRVIDHFDPALNDSQLLSLELLRAPLSGLRASDQSTRREQRVEKPHLIVNANP